MCRIDRDRFVDGQGGVLAQVDSACVDPGLALVTKKRAPSGSLSCEQPGTASVHESKLPMLPRASCLRKESAYGLKVRLDAVHPRTRCPEALSPSLDQPLLKKKKKKSVSFADDHGSALASPVLFRLMDPPSTCHAVEVACKDEQELMISEMGTWSERLRCGAPRSQDVLSLCVLSCSLLGCFVLGMRHLGPK